MKLKTLSFIAGAIALTLTAVPYIAQAQAHSPSPLLVAQDADGDKGPWAKLNLSPEQKQQIKQINHSANSQIHQLLNIPEGQRINYKSLTPDQKKEVRQIRKQAAQNIYTNVLNDTQRQQVDQYRQNHPHHKRGGQDSNS